MFEECKGEIKSVLVLGPAGIGKTTFCKYIAHQWATGKLWSRYHLVALISLRSLTKNNYPPVKNYSLIDLLEIEYYSCSKLSEEDKRFFEDQCNKHQILWLLDGYDEFVQNIPEHLKKLFEHLRTTQHHILTSRPYLNKLAYDVQMEITGFTDNNIKNYVKQFYDQTKDQLSDASSKSQKLLDFLQLNPRIWGVAHIPINLELICSLWSDTDWSEITTLTMTTLYEQMTEWLCRRHLEKQNVASDEMAKEDVYTRLQKELAFLESLAFNGMESKSIILEPKLLRIALNESRCSSYPLNIGILKSLCDEPIGTCIETDKKYYFLHLSFQEHFAARYLVKAFKGTPDQKEKAIDFIKTNKYNQRFELVFTFASGLLLDPIDSIDEQCRNLFWEILLGEPLDLVGFRHVQIVITCLEEAGCDRQIPHFRELMNLIIQWIRYYVFVDGKGLDHQFLASLQRSLSLVNQPEILDTFIKLYNVEDIYLRYHLCSLISDLPISNPATEWIHLYLTELGNNDMDIKISAREAFEMMEAKERLHEQMNRDFTMSECIALVKMGHKAASSDVINTLLIRLSLTAADLRSSPIEILGEIGKKAVSDQMINELLILLGDNLWSVRIAACNALAKMGEKAATDKVLKKILILLDNTNDGVRSSACDALSNMGEKAETNEVINKLLVLLGDSVWFVRSAACNTLAKMGEKAENDKVLKKLLTLLDDTNDGVRSSACDGLAKMGEKAATNELINKLIILLFDNIWLVRGATYDHLPKMGGTTATNKLVNKLLILLDNTNFGVRRSACDGLAKIGEKAVNDEVIDRLSILFSDGNDEVRSSVRDGLAKMGEKAATNELINKLLILLGHNGWLIRSAACDALAKIGGTTAINKVVNKLLILLDNTNFGVRRSARDALAKMGEKQQTIK